MARWTLTTVILLFCAATAYLLQEETSIGRYVVVLVDEDAEAGKVPRFILCKSADSPNVQKPFYSIDFAESRDVWSALEPGDRITVQNYLLYLFAGDLKSTTAGFPAVILVKEKLLTKIENPSPDKTAKQERTN